LETRGERGKKEGGWECPVVGSEKLFPGLATTFPTLTSPSSSCYILGNELEVNIVDIQDPPSPAATLAV